MSLAVAAITVALASTGESTSSVETVVEDAQVTLIREVRVPAREQGALSDVLVKENNLVQAGDVLAQMDSDLAVMDEQQAKIEMEIARLQSENKVDQKYAKKALEVAEAKLNRSLGANTLRPKTVTDMELDEMRLVVEQSLLAIEQSDRDLEVAGLTKMLKEQAVGIAAAHVERRRIVAPISGMVVQVFQNAGEWLNPGDPLVRIIQMDPLRVEAFVDGTKYGRELNGCPVRFSVNLPPGDRVAHFRGHVVFVSPELQPVNGQVRIWAEVDNHDLQLRPGSRGTLRIDASKTQSVRRSPKSVTGVDGKTAPSAGSTSGGGNG